MHRSYDVQFKLLFVGSGEVGKSSLIRRLILDDFSDDYDPTPELISHIHTIGVDPTYKLAIVDTPGQERFAAGILLDSNQGIFPSVARDGVAVVFDVTNRETFGWARRRLSLYQAERSTYFILIGNKCDLADGEGGVREVAVEEAAELAERLHCPYIETSAATGMNVESAFAQLLSDIRHRVHVKPGRH